MNCLDINPGALAVIGWIVFSIFSRLMRARQRREAQATELPRASTPVRRAAPIEPVVAQAEEQEDYASYAGAVFDHYAPQIYTGNEEAALAADEAYDERDFEHVARWQPHHSASEAYDWKIPGAQAARAQVASDDKSVLRDALVLNTLLAKKRGGRRSGSGV